MEPSHAAVEHRITTEVTDSTVSALAKVGGSAVTFGGSAIWAAGSYLSSYVGGERRSSGVRSCASDGTMRGLGSAEVLRIANTLSGIFSTRAPSQM